ncbi:MAG: DNA topoisomerase IB [Dehalococcoidia bacterium]|nr:DNA topoisomerase IB [Dehalococcoidia bacterium]
MRAVARPVPRGQEDPAASARAAGLRYVSPALPGIRRRRAHGGFRYVDAHGDSVRDAATLQRVRALAIPPAWEDVWICPLPSGHLQATGRDARGRKQYRYHPRWRTVRDANKYDHTLAFASALPRIRSRVAADLARPGLPREKVVATVVRLLDETLIRVGNDEYVRANSSYGVTTLRDHHVHIDGAALRFRFRGKAGKRHDVGLRDRRLARVVRQCRDLPGHDLFQYLDGQGERQPVGSGDVNAYLREACGQDFTAKDFRTWAGTVLAAATLAASEPPASESQAKSTVARAVESVAERLGNTPAVCRKCYVHPAVLDAYRAGTLAGAVPPSTSGPPASEALGADEAAVLVLLEHAGAQPGRAS